MLLAYDLYEINKDSDKQVAKKITPIKKIFVGKDVTVDERIDLVKPSDKNISYVVDWLSMHLNTDSYDQIQLPDLTVQSSQKPAYVMIFCTLDKKAVDGNYTFEIRMTCGKEPKMCTATYDLTNYKATYETADVKIRLNQTDYFTDGKNLFDYYVQNKILDKDATLSGMMFKKIATAFFEYVKGCKFDPDQVRQKKTPFRLYILPTEKPVTKKQAPTQQNTKSFVDSFGNKADSYPTKTTLTGKFLSFDDKAFTVNCTKADVFYKDVGIGNNSLEKINLPMSNMMRIGKFSWFFIDMKNPEMTFENQKKGLLAQLHANYCHFKSGGLDRLPRMKILCVLLNQNKTEVILEENLTMLRQKKMFENLKNPPNSALELMIHTTKSKKDPIWADYIRTVRAYLQGNKLDRNYFVQYFTMEIKKQIQDWIKKETDAVWFYKKSECILNLISSNTFDPIVESDAEYAYNVGKITRMYIDFVRSNPNEQNNSSNDIVQYSKYDKKTLELVFSKIGRAIALSKQIGDKIIPLEKNIQSILPDIDMEEENYDFSYYFYKGYFAGGRTD